MSDEEEIIAPKFWDKRAVQTLVMVFVFASTIIGATWAADERWARNADVASQIQAVTEDFESQYQSTAAAVTEVKTDLTIKIKTDERGQAQSRVYELQDRMASAKTFNQRQEYLALKREQEERLRLLDIELNRLTEKKAEAQIIRAGPPPLPALVPLRSE